MRHFKLIFLLVAGFYLTNSIKHANAFDRELEISWDYNDPLWKGMILTNVGHQTVNVNYIELNNREDCKLVPYSISELEKAFTGNNKYLLMVMAMASNSFGAKHVLMDNRLSDETVMAFDQSVELKVGNRIGMIDLSCGVIVRARIFADETTFDIEFSQPYKH